MPDEPSPSATGSSAPPNNPWGEAPTPFDQIGGMDAVRALVDAFYDRITSDSPAMRELHPPDLTESRQKLHEFLVGWLGGPQLYISKHGHPRLRMRHAPFPIDAHAVQEWLRCMNNAMDDRAIAGPLRTFLEARFNHTAWFMQNRE